MSASMSELFVFGAGASHASGATPLGKDLVWNYYEDCSTWYEIGSNERPSESDLEHKRKEFSDFGEFLKRIKYRYPDLSEISKKWERAMNAGETFIPNIAKTYYIDEIMEHLIQEAKHKNEVGLIKRIAAQHITKTSIGRSNGFYKKFVKSLKNKNRENISIISFNFDCLLRDDLDDQIYFDYLINFDEIDSRRCFYKAGRGIPLIKLHGSLDWQWDSHSDIMTLLPDEWHDGCGGEPRIFLPHENANCSINRLWEMAADLIKRTEKITFVGYSLPEYDQDAIKLFQSNTHDATRIEVIDISQDIINRYKTLFPESHLYGSVCDLSNDGIVVPAERT